MELIHGKVGDFMEPIQGKGDSLLSRLRGRGIVMEPIQRKSGSLWSRSRGRGIVYGADPEEGG